MNHMKLSKEESEILKDIILSLSQRAKYQFSLNQLINQWREFVLNIESGYEDSIYEYTNDLSTRDLLEEILQNTPASLNQKLSELIKPWDHRFIDATIEIKKPLTTGKLLVLSYWWFRIPKNISEELKKDFRDEGIIE